MNNKWIAFTFLLLIAPVLAGCPEAPKTDEKPPAAKVEPAAVPIPASELAIDPTLLPPPRTALATAPDLQDARLVINDDTLASMSSNAVPSEVVDSLRALNGQDFSNASQFVEAVMGASNGAAEPYLDLILLSAMVMNSAEVATAPQGEMSIAEAERRAQETAAATALVQPQSDFELVYFDFDKSDIKSEFVQAIRTNAGRLRTNPSMAVTIEGHADERGTNEYNLALGERRAQAVREALIAEGVDAGQLSTYSWGEERPAVLGSNEDAWAKNRRGLIVAK